MKRILLTGFEPFGGSTVNPSWQVAEALHGEAVAGARIVALWLPCVFGDALQVLHSALDEHRPALVLALGLAAGRCDFSIERVAINIDDARIADNAGAQPVDCPVVDGAPAAYFGTLPIKAMVSGLRKAGFPASVSQTAGTFVCNHVYYGLMHALHDPLRIPWQTPSPTRAGFMHLPQLPEQAASAPGGQPSMALQTMVAGVRTALACALQHGAAADLPLGAGTLA